MYAVIDRCWAI